VVARRNGDPITFPHLDSQHFFTFSTTIETRCTRNQYITMPRRPLADTTPAQKAAIVMRKSFGMTTRQIASKENVSPSTVSRITNQYDETSDFTVKGKKKGQQCKMSKRDVDLACRMLSSSRCKNATDIQHTFFPHLHVDTIQNSLRKHGLKAYTRQSKPLLTGKQKTKRVDWAESHCYWEDENWGAVVFSGC